jgi:hypothetical protein
VQEAIDGMCLNWLISSTGRSIPRKFAETCFIPNSNSDRINCFSCSLDSGLGQNSRRPASNLLVRTLGSSLLAKSRKDSWSGKLGKAKLKSSRSAFDYSQSLNSAGGVSGNK